MQFTALRRGLDPEMIRQMDRWLERYALLARQSFPKADPNQPGTGAAGGLGFAFLSFTNAVLESGIKLVLEETRLADYIKDADIVITGGGTHGRSDCYGKKRRRVLPVLPKPLESRFWLLRVL